MTCLGHAAQVGRENEKYRALGAQGAVIGSGGLGTPLMRAMKLTIPVLVDRDKSIYRLYGLESSVGIQQSATFVIDRDGIIRWRKASFNPGASFRRDEVRAVVEALT
jgi:peroxiredoxin